MEHQEEAMSAFPVRLRELRESLNLSQNEFSKRLNISRVSLTHYEAGDRTPDIDFLTRLHQETGASLYFMLGITDSKEDALATAQRSTGLSEKALNCLAEDKKVTDLVNQFLSHHEFPTLAHRLMVLHDNEFFHRKTPEMSAKGNNILTPGLRKTMEFQMDTNELATEILYSDPASYEIDKIELPYYMVRFNNFMDRLSALLDGMSAPIGKEELNEIEKMMKEFEQSSSKLDSTSEEATHGEETPKS